MPDRLKRDIPRTDDRENAREDREQQDEPQSMWFKTPLGFSGGAKGRHLTHLLYVTLLASIIMAAGYVNHIATIKAIADHEQSTLVRTKENQVLVVATQKQIEDMKKEIVYVLIQDESQRKRLNLEMPASLRERIERGDRR